jgi:hypothetical protein
MKYIFPKKLNIEDNVISIVYGEIDKDELKNNNFFDDLVYTNEVSPRNVYEKIITSPDYFIFHKSRYGSTLLCNMVKECDDYIVFIEPKIILECFALNIPEDIRIKILKKIFYSFCSECNKFNKKTVFKLTSYTIQYYDLLKALFTDTTTIYITRDNLEVIKSNVYKPTNTTRTNNLNAIKNFPNLDNNNHFLAHIFEMDSLGNKCDHIISYNDIIQPTFIDTIEKIFNLNIDKNVLDKVLKEKEYYSKFDKQKKKFNSKNLNTGIEIYDFSLSKDFCLELTNLIDTLGNYTEISIKKCITLSLFDLEFWRYYDKNNDYPIQKKLNIKYNNIFLKLKNILNERLLEYCNKYKYFSSSLLMKKTDNLKNDIVNNTDIVSINFTKYEPKIHDCNVFHSEDSFVSIDESTRKTAFIVYLNTVNNGGVTEFYFQDLKIKPKIGRIAFFPPNWLCTHKGNVTVDENKYILTGWIHTKINVNNKLLPFYKVKYENLEC